MTEQNQLNLLDQVSQIDNSSETKLNFDFLLHPADFSARAKLAIEALAPLSMVASLPGKYYRSQREPTAQMLYGLIENALGWHISDVERKELERKLKNKFQRELEKSGVGFVSVLQFHLRFAASLIPPLLHYDDLWAQHLKGGSFIGGSRNYDSRAIKIMNAERGKRVAINDLGGSSKDSEKLHHFEENDKIHVNVVKPYFPQYYVSPTPREYVIPQGEYVFVVETNEVLADILHAAFDNPAAPLYLGSNDGWVEARWEVFE
jgi:CRISPR-associated protein Cas5